MQVYLIQEKETEKILIEGISKAEALQYFTNNQLSDKSHEIIIDDLFKYPELIPENVQTILDSRDFSKDGYQELARIQNETEAIGYTFDSGLDADPYELREL